MLASSPSFGRENASSGTRASAASASGALPVTFLTIGRTASASVGPCTSRYQPR